MRNKGDTVRVLYRHPACNAARRVVYTITDKWKFRDEAGVEHEAAMRGESVPVAACPACGKLRLGHEVVGTVTDHKCGSKCLNSKGPSCECACGGANHGAGHG